MLRGLVRQQEDATRLLGEKMRNEAQEHVSGYTCYFIYTPVRSPPQKKKIIIIIIK